MSGESVDRLSGWRLLAYGQLVVPLAVVGLPIAIYIPPFYADTLGLNLAWIGIILMVARISDAFTDPLIGRLSDRTHTPWGRRRPWVLLGIPVMMVSAYMLFLPGENVTPLYLLVWIALIYLGFTLIGIPYGAWGAELSTDYAERNRVTGYREVFLLLGLLIAITAPIVGSAGQEESSDGSITREAMATLGWLVMGLLPLGAVILFSFVSEPPVRQTRNISLLKGLRIALRNGPFRIVLGTSLLGAFAGSINAGVALLFFQHVAQIGNAGFVLILVLFSAAVVGSPFWIRIGSKIGKHRGMAVAGIISLVAFGTVPILIYVVRPVAPDLVIPGLVLVSVIQGLAAGASPILGPSMLADVVDLDTIKSGEQRTALIFSYLGIVRKFAEAAGVGIALPILAWIGFDPTVEPGSGANSAEALFGLTAMYCMVPLSIWLVAIALIWNFPLTAERQARLRAGLERRTRRRAKMVAEPAD